jgi:glycosyltransferase involved in cell wall biosynthesis
MHITVCVCTRDRGSSVVATLRSLLASDYEDFDIVIIDQSAGNETERALDATIGADPRFHYIHSQTKGLSRSRSLAVRSATGPIIAFTDDDCEVAPDWLSVIASLFAKRPDVDVICGAAHAAPFDSAKGFIPAVEPQTEYVVASPWLKWRERGGAASMAMRKSIAERAGYFDPLLGPGALFQAGEDWDFTYRVLAAGGSILVTPRAAVVHFGFRDLSQARRLLRTYSRATGAAFMKELRLGDLAVLPTLLIVWFRCINWRRLLMLRRANGVGNFIAYARGMLASFHYPIDRATRTYRGLSSNRISTRAPLEKSATRSRT